MPYTTPYVSGAYREEPYNNRRVGRLADLIRARGDIEAQGLREQGNISAQMWGGIGQTVAGTLGQLAQYKMDQPRREHDTLLRTEQARQLSEAERLRGVERFAGESQLDPTKRAAFFEQAGFTKEAGEIRSRDTAQKINDLQLSTATAAHYRKQLSEGADLLRDIKKSPDPLGQYATVRDKAAKLYGDLGNQFPEVYNEASIDQLISAGTTAADSLALSEAATRAAAAARAAKKDSMEEFLNGTKLGAILLGAADSNETYVAGYAKVKEHGGDAAAALFSPTYSTEAKQRAMSLSKAMAGGNDTPFSAAVDAWSRERGGKLPGVNDITKILSDQATATYRWNPLTGSGGTSRKTQMTPTQLRAADTWKVREDNKVYAGVASGDIEEGDVPRLLEAIQSEYLVRRGDPDGPSLAEYDRMRGGGAAPPVAPASPPAAPAVAGTGTGAPPVAAPKPKGRFRVFDGTGYIEYDTREQQAAAQALIDAEKRPAPKLGPPAPPVAPVVSPAPVMRSGIPIQPQQAPVQEPQAAPSRPVAPPPSGKQVTIEINGRRGMAYESEVPQLIAAGGRVVDSSIPPPSAAPGRERIVAIEWADGRPGMAYEFEIPEVIRKGGRVTGGSAPPAAPAPQRSMADALAMPRPSRHVAPPLIAAGGEVLVRYRGLLGIAYKSEIPALVEAGATIITDDPNSLAIWRKSGGRKTRDAASQVDRIVPQQKK